MQLRDYQQKDHDAIFEAWGTYQNICYVLPTGGGKTHVFSNVIKKSDDTTCVIAHRNEILTQISLSLAKNGVYHNIISPAGNKLIKTIVASQLRKFKRDHYDPNSKVTLVGVDTLLRRADRLRWWADRVKLWVIDEGHHIQENNKWGKAVQLFKNAKGLAVTATPCRLDGGGLGRNNGGFFDTLTVGPDTRDLIRRGYLSPYKIYGSFTNIDLSGLKKARNGDWVQRGLAARVRRSTITGDVVRTYKKYADGLLGITFATDIKTAGDFVNDFRAAGVPAEIVTAKTPIDVRDNIFTRFENRELLQVINVDILGEGFDCPAVECVSLARPTESFSLYRQQVGRVLRTMPDKPDKVALIFDHVQNVIRHGLPDKEVEWSLEDGGYKVKGDGIVPTRACPACVGVYEGYSRTCPYCGHTHVPIERSQPEFVEGDITEMDPVLMQKLFGEISWVDQSEAEFKNAMQRAGHSTPIILSGAKHHRNRQTAQAILREVMAIWAGVQAMPIKDKYVKFWRTFGIDVLSAKALGKPEAVKLTDDIIRRLQNG